MAGDLEPSHGERDARAVMRCRERERRGMRKQDGCLVAAFRRHQSRHRHALGLGRSSATDNT
jgi:hypothetical protein